ncbi:MAG: serine protease [Chthoniobacteraceae bacterium]
MKTITTIILTIIALYLSLYFKVIPYKLVRITTPDETQDKPAASPALPQNASPAVQNPPAASASVASHTPASQPVQATQLIADYHGALLLVEGLKGVGSGFICNMDGHTYAITNAHVLSDNVGVKLTSLGGTAFTAGPSAVAVGHDIVKMEVPAIPKAFEIMTNLDNNVKIGDAVIVLGNAEGGGVVRPTEGKIVGIGPDLVEVDAPFVKGNSGSPIIHVPTGKVVGIATYLIERKVTPGENGGVTLGTRRFGYRLDNIQNWETINWQVFFAEAAQVAQIESLSQDFIKMSEDVNSGEHHFVASNYANPALQRSINSFIQDASRQGISKSDKLDLLHNFFAELRSSSRSDITAFNARPSYDYFRREVADQSLFRDELYTGFTRVMESFQK